MQEIRCSIKAADDDYWKTSLIRHLYKAKGDREADLSQLEPENAGWCKAMAEKAEMFFDYSEELKYGRIRIKQPSPTYEY